MLTQNDYLHRCAQLAELAGKSCRPNPKVGAVLVHNNRIIGEGYHRRYGEAHAEVNAVHSVDESDRSLISSSTLYVSLEPCSHHGKTPPCTDLIIKYRIPKVVIGSLDPTDKVTGVDLLRAAGVDVTVLEHDACREACHIFAVNTTLDRPFVQLKFAKSADNYIGKVGEQVWLSNDLARVFTHKLRAETDAIMVGTTTAVIDNPSLTTRYYPGESPIRVVLDRSGRIPASHTLLQDCQSTWVITEHMDGPGIRIQVDFDRAEFLQHLLRLLYKRGICHLTVEGGGRLLQSFVEIGLWDQAVVIDTPTILDTGIRSPNITGALQKHIRLKDNIVYIIKNTNIKSRS